MSDFLYTDLNQLAQEAHKIAIEKGFWEKQRNIGELYMLIISEIGEALEAHRKDQICALNLFQLSYMLNSEDGDRFMLLFRDKIKDTFQDEIADTVIRIFDFAVHAHIDCNPAKHNVDVYIPKTSNLGEKLFHITKLLVWTDAAECETDKTYFINIALLILAQIANEYKFDLLLHIKLKLRYNQTREPLHGKKY